MAQPVKLQLLLTSKHISTDIPSGRISLTESLFLPFSSGSIHTSTQHLFGIKLFLQCCKEFGSCLGWFWRDVFYFVCVSIAPLNILSPCKLSGLNMALNALICSLNLAKYFFNAQDNELAQPKTEAYEIKTYHNRLPLTSKYFCWNQLWWCIPPTSHPLGYSTV